MFTKYKTLHYSKHHNATEGGDYYIRHDLRRLYLSDFLWYGKIIKIENNLVIGIHKSGKYFYAVNAADCDSDFDNIDEWTRVYILRVTAENIACIK